jgi:hypothetical protein
MKLTIRLIGLFLLWQKVSPIAAQTVSPETVLLRPMFEHILVVFRQDYGLKSGDKVYGRNKKEQFGRQYSLAVLAQNRFWADSILLYPWKSDLAYLNSRFANDAEVQPVLTKTAIRYWEESKFEEIQDMTLDSMARPMPQVGPFRQYTSQTRMELGVNKAYLESLTEEDTISCLVTIYADKNLFENDTAKLKIQIQLVKPQFKFEKGFHTAKIDPPKVANWLGSAYFRIQGGHGQLEARLAGMVLKMDKLGFDWRIVALPSNRTPTEKPETKPSNDKDIELTPIEMAPKEKPKSVEDSKDKPKNGESLKEKPKNGGDSKEKPKNGEAVKEQPKSEEDSKEKSKNSKIKKTNDSY